MIDIWLTKISNKRCCAYENHFVKKKRDRDFPKYFVLVLLC